MLALLTLSLALAESPVEVGGVVVTTLPQPPRAVVAPREGEVLVLTAAGELQMWQLEGGSWVQRWARAEPDAAGLFVAGGRAWIERHEIRAEPVGGADLAPAPASGATAAPAAPAAPAPKAGAVVRGEQGEVVVDLGRADGLRVGTELRFLRREEVESFSGEGTTTAEREVGTGVVEALEAGQALVTLSRGSRVEPGDIAEIQPRASGYPLAPDRLGDLSEVGITLRPLLALETVGVAFVNEAWATYAFEAPWYVEARLSPLGLGWSQDGNPLSVAAVAAGGYDSRWFSVGLGAGWSMLNSDVSFRYAADYETAGGAGENLDFEDVEGAFSLAQQARLGARDGLNLTVRNTFVLVPEYTYDYGDCDTEYYYYGSDPDCATREKTGSAFAFGGIGMRLTVPTSDRADLFVDWGTGEAGATWITGGVGAWARGNGDVGSVGLEVAAGYGSLAGDPDDEYVELYGPLVSVGARWRR